MLGTIKKNNLAGFSSKVKLIYKNTNKVTLSINNETRRNQRVQTPQACLTGVLLVYSGRIVLATQHEAIPQQQNSLHNKIHETQQHWIGEHKII